MLVWSGLAVASWNSPVPMPKGMVKYKSEKYTQSIFRIDNQDAIRKVLIINLEDKKWLQSGGMRGIKGWRSDKYKLIPEKPSYWLDDIKVKNGIGPNTHQNNLGLKRKYAEGTRFDDVLSNDKNVVFEHRSRRKIYGNWRSSILYYNIEARPAGYKGLSITCISCHREAGTGKYAVGLVPGGDTILSDPMYWDMAKRYFR